jgi:hypothetical protein
MCVASTRGVRAAERCDLPILAADIAAVIAVND